MTNKQEISAKAKIKNDEPKVKVFLTKPIKLEDDNGKDIMIFNLEDAAKKFGAYPVKFAIKKMRKKKNTFVVSFMIPLEKEVSK